MRRRLGRGGLVHLGRRGRRARRGRGSGLWRAGTGNLYGELILSTSRDLQAALNARCDRVRGTEDAPSCTFQLLEHRHGLAEIVERGVGVPAERLRVNPPHPERSLITLSENAPGHGHCFSQQRFGFFEAP